MRGLPSRNLIGRRLLRRRVPHNVVELILKELGELLKFRGLAIVFSVLIVSVARENCLT